MPPMRPMTETEHRAWLARIVPAYAADKVESGQWSQDESLAASAREFDELLPQGPATPDNFLYTLLDAEGRAVGSLWFALRTKFNARIAFVYDVEVAPEHRRQGHAWRAFQALDDEVRALGLSGIALHVFGHNAAAQALYAKLGFRATHVSLFKPVDPA